MAMVLQSCIDHIKQSFSRFSAPINTDMIASQNTIVFIIVKSDSLVGLLVNTLFCIPTLYNLWGDETAG